MKPVHAIKIESNGTVEKISLNSYEDYRKAVGGDIELIGLKDGSIAYINEDGKMLNLDYNKKATDLCKGLIQEHDCIVGTMIVLGHGDGEGNDTSITEEMEAEILQLS